MGNPTTSANLSLEDQATATLNENTVVSTDDVKEEVATESATVSAEGEE